MSAGPSLLEHHPKRKADKHKSQYAGAHVVESAARLESPTQRTRCPRNAYIHRHHDDGEDHAQQCDLQRASEAPSPLRLAFTSMRIPIHIR
jgi:hypothetical protein